jgi:hypothetical protein
MSDLAELQSLALEFSQSSTAVELGTALWVAFVVDATHSWRLVETVRSASGSLRRRDMLCFRSLDEIRSAVEERVAWTLADWQFRATHMYTPAGLPGVTGDWVPSKDFDLIFASSRRLLREQICRTRSGQTVMLR